MKKVFLLVFAALLLVDVSAQSVSIDGVKGRRFNGVIPIVSGEDEAVSGYYTYYMVEKQQKGMRTFEFAIIDKDVKKVSKIPITLH